MTITRSMAMGLLLALAPVAGVPPALAQATAEDPTTAMARARFKEGVDFYDKGAYEQARASFLQAYALKKHPTVLLNLAWSCLKSGRALDAERYFRQFLGESKEISEKQRADAADGLNQSRAKLGRIEIVAGTGTEVSLDGERLGAAPIGDPVTVEAGAHTVNFRGADGLSDTQSITVGAGEKAVARFRTTLPPPAGAAAPPLPPTEEPARPSRPAQVTPASPPLPEKPLPEQPAGHPSLEPSTPATEQAPADEGASVFGAPKNLLPVVVLGLGAVAGYGTAVAMYLSKQSAEDKADSIVGQLKAIPNGNGNCTTQPKACDALHTDVDNINTDATVGNIAVGVGVAATVGAVVYWLASDKRGEGKVVGANPRPVLLPLLGPGLGGAALAGRF